MEAEYLTVTQAAQVLGVHRNTIANALRSGRLRGYKLNGTRWRIKRTDLDTFLTEPERPNNGTSDSNT